MNQPFGHVVIGIPSNRDIPHAVYQFIAGTQLSLFKMGYLCTPIIFGSSDLEDSRNAIMSQFWAEKSYTDIIMMDDDVHAGPGTIERLMSHPVDFVLCAYRLKQDGETYAIRKLPGPMQCVDPLTGEPRPDGIAKIAGGPGGLMRLKRSVVDRFVESYPDLWYHQKKVTGGKAWRFFEFDVIDHERIGEDMNFCRKWRAIGGDVWCDPHIMTHHIGPATFSGRFADQLARNGLMPSVETVQRITLDPKTDEMMRGIVATSPQIT